MKQLNPQIGLEQELNRQIYEALQGSVVEEVLSAVRWRVTASRWSGRCWAICMICFMR